MSSSLLSVSQAATLKGVTRSAVYAAISRGDLDSQRVLGHVAVTEADVNAWQPIGHKKGRPKGTPMTEEVKSRISLSQKRRWQQRKE